MDTLFKIIIVGSFFVTLILSAVWAQWKFEEYWGESKEDNDGR